MAESVYILQLALLSTRIAPSFSVIAKV